MIPINHPIATMNGKKATVIPTATKTGKTGGDPRW
jgi:hypothetical protein